MTPSIFDGLRAIAEEHAGIAMRPGKEALVSARLAKRIRSLGLGGARNYLAHLRRAPASEVAPFLDAITTNVTSFFREPEHFAFLAEHVAARVEAGARRIRIWSAACSTGEEPLTMAMVLEDLLSQSPVNVDWRILATDVSRSALERARRCRYSHEDVARIPEDVRARHMELRDDAWEPMPGLVGHLAVEWLNLAKTPYPMTGPLDVVFCRNAMIYLSRETKLGVVREVERLLRPGGLFVVGHAETLHGLDAPSLEMVAPSVYRKVSAD